MAQIKAKFYNTEKARKDMESTFADIEAQVKAYNDAVLAGESKVIADIGDDETKPLITVVKENVNAYAEAQKLEVFEALKKTENPMLAAVIQLTYKVKRLREVAPENAESDIIKILKIDEAERLIDIQKLHAYCGSIGHDPKHWLGMLESLNRNLTDRVKKDLGHTDSVVDYATSFLKEDTPEIAKVSSNTALLKELQKCFVAMVGEGYKATSHQVNFLLYCYCKARIMKVTASTHAQFRGLCAQMLNWIITGNAPIVEYKKAKKQG